MNSLLRCPDHLAQSSRPAFLPAAFLLALAFIASPLFAQEEPVSSLPDSITEAGPLAPAAPTAVIAVDRPNDAGGAITISWELSADDAAGLVTEYKILRAVSAADGPGLFSEIGNATAGQNRFEDGNVEDDRAYFYKVVALNTQRESGLTLSEAAAESDIVGPVESHAQWFNTGRSRVLVGVLILSGLIIHYIRRARAGRDIFIRKIAGLEAVDEAVGRATEMGKKIFYIPGSQDMDNVQTLAGITILGRVAELAAQYETHLEVPVSRSLVMVTSREVVKEAYIKVGRTDFYKDDQVKYLTDDQFGYAAAIDGMVVRERPATIFLMGSFYAEALVLAETGNSVGAIQIAGTGQPSQLPFFVAACDYTLIGEELFAASAYLSKEPRQLGSLKGQDVGKGLILVAIAIGIILETLHIWDVSKLFTVID